MSIKSEASEIHQRTVLSERELNKINIIKWIGLSRLYATLETSKLFVLLGILK